VIASSGFNDIGFNGSVVRGRPSDLEEMQDSGFDAMRESGLDFSDSPGGWRDDR
jgi:hypothetical protein